MRQHLAIYLRLSLEDMNIRNNKLSDESNSIRNQRLLIEKYISEHADLAKYPVVEYSDDGYSGTNFDRPGVQKMLEKIKTGEIVCVVVKDLSRFGRSYLEVGDYLEHIFPLLGVRFIAINDHYDSSRHIGSTAGIDVAFRNLVAERYSQDLSEKIKSSRYIQMRKGKFVSHCPYGYMRHPTQKHQMVPDPETAPVVKTIFRLAIEGKKSTEIAAMLNDCGIPTPLTKKNWDNPNVKNDVMWSHQAVLRIIQDYKYTGAMVSFKCGNEKVRAKVQKRYKKEDWVIVEGCHEPLVSKEEFEKANEMIRKVRYQSRNKTDCKDRLYYCGCCGRRLRKTFGLDEYFSCQTQLYKSKADCASIFWSKTELETVLTQAYRIQLQLLQDELEALTAHVRPDPLLECRMRQGKVSREIEGINSRNLHLYETYRGGGLSRDEFIKQKEAMTVRLKDLKSQLEELQQQENRLAEEAAETGNRQEQIRAVLQQIILSDDELKPFVYDAVTRVDVYPNRDLEITWKHSDIKQEVS